MMIGGELGWVRHLASCDHLVASLSSDLARIPTPDTPCNMCKHPRGNWLCLCCKEVLCSRYVNKHMLRHYREKNHSVALDYSDLSVWCFACHAYLNAQPILQLRPVHETSYVLKFGRALPFNTGQHPKVKEDDEMMLGAESGSVRHLTSCDHLVASLSTDLARIPNPDTPCNSRYVNKHMLQHYQETNHSVALGYSDLSVWCFACHAYLNAQAILQLRPVHETSYVLKFGETLPFNTGQHPEVKEDDEMMLGAESGWVRHLTSCDHLVASLSTDLARIPNPDTPCNRCQHPRGNWLCLCCKEVLCSRYVNKHMLRHYREKNHSVALGYSDLSVWCFACDAYLNAQPILQLRPVHETSYVLKFGRALPFNTGQHPKVKEDDEMMFGAESGWVRHLTSCDHLIASLSSDLARIPNPDTPCNSRYVNKHMLQHYQETNHSVALGYSDLSVWCFACHAYLNAQAILQLQPVHETAYVLKFGRALPFLMGEHPKV
ncbi:hypothetical protein KPL70_022408 [Citrus sinensis]|nr:hypothetical protein KPL70_022408 [Citrus sinensis]